MRITTSFAVIATLALSSAIGCSNTSARDASVELSIVDRTFAENAVASGKIMVDGARLASEKASSDQVKQYAAQLVSAQSAANDELASLLQQKHIEIDAWPDRRDGGGSTQGPNDSTTLTKQGGPPRGSPSPTGTSGSMGTVATTGEELDREKAGTAKPWMQASGTAFDAGFIAAQAKTHYDAIALFDEESTTGTDPELKAFAAKHISRLRDQVRQVEQLQSEIRQNH